MDRKNLERRSFLQGLLGAVTTLAAQAAPPSEAKLEEAKRLLDSSVQSGMLRAASLHVRHGELSFRQAVGEASPGTRAWDSCWRPRLCRELPNIHSETTCEKNSFFLWKCEIANSGSVISRSRKLLKARWKKLPGYMEAALIPRAGTGIVTTGETSAHLGVGPIPAAPISNVFCAVSCIPTVHS